MNEDIVIPDFLTKDGARKEQKVKKMIGIVGGLIVVLGFCHIVAKVIVIHKHLINSN